MSMMKRPLIVTIAIVCIVLLIVSAAGLFFLYDHLKTLETRRDDIVEAAKSAFGRDVRYDRAVFSLRTGPSFTFTGVAVRERDGTTDFLTVERMILRVAVLPLLKKELVIQNLKMYRPRMAISRDTSGRWSVEDLMASKADNSIRIRRVTIQEGTVNLRDQYVSAIGTSLILKDLNAAFRGFSWGQETSVDLKTAVIHGAKEGKIEAKGTLSMPGKGKSWIETAVDMRLRANHMDLTAFVPYCEHYAAFTTLKGALDGDMAIKGRWMAFDASGTVAMKDVKLNYPRAFSSALTPQLVQIDYEMKRVDGSLSLRKLDLAVDAFQARGALTISGLGQGDPALSVQVRTNAFSFEKYHAYIPDRLLPASVAAYIRDHIRGGVFRLAEGNLSGRLSQIGNMNQIKNAHVLQARLGVEGGILTYGPTAPVFTDIKGELVFQGPDFSLKGMSGRFGDSPLTLEGAIRNYCLDGPSTYPFSMTMTATAKEAAWLLGAEAMKTVTIQGTSTLKLIGDGLLDRYQLKGDWDLTPVAYADGRLIKPAGRMNRLQATAEYGSGQWMVPKLQYDLPPLSLSGKVLYRFRNRDHVSIALESNVFDLKALMPMVPAIRPYEAEGAVRLQMNGESRPGDWKSLLWKGEMSLMGVSVIPAEKVRKVQNIAGILKIDDRDVSTAGLSATVGRTMFNVKGWVKNMDHPTVNVTFASALLDMADFGWANPKGPVRLLDLKGLIVMNAAEIQISSLSARLNDSVLNAVVSWPRQVTNPVVNVQFTAPILNHQDVLLLSGLGKSPFEAGRGARSYEGTVHVGKGRLDNLDYANLHTRFSYSEPKLVIHSFNADAWNGKISGTGTVDVADKARPVYEFDFRMAGVPAGSLIRLTEMPPDMMSGTVTSRGRITASGLSREEIKKSLRGALDLQVEKGVLKKFAVLSKIFSILNVSQLLTFHLPDMAEGGMPFTKLTAAVSARDGLLTTEDALLKSEAINIVAVGQIDMVKETMDMSVGVQPLQSVDKVVSRIPVLGWILTDTDRRFITVHFEARGPWKDPIVRAVPVRELAKEVLNIFRRVFQLPMKLVTDTGDVI